MEMFESKYSQFVCDANEAVYFKLVREESELTLDDGFFHPDMSHQIFGEKEQIFGYTNLRINIFYTASYLHAYVKITYSRKIDPAASEGVEADKIMMKLKDVLPTNFATNIDEFSLLLHKESNFHPYGQTVDAYSRSVKGSSIQRHFKTYKADMENVKFREYHNRMESFILWFIDAASFIDVDDGKWDYYLIFEKVTENCSSRYFFVGYSTCYRFYAYPDKCRPRISQVLILPPYQRQGHCSSLIQAIYQQYVPRSDVLDITAEDPSENFQRVRDFVDAQNCMLLKEFSSSKLHGPFLKEMAKAAREDYKINKRQARRIYEILRLRSTNENDDAEFTKFRLAIKARINQPMNDMRKKCRFLANNSSLLPPVEERHTILQREFENCLEEYRKVIHRLELS